jgi:hypothetical protein
MRIMLLEVTFEIKPSNSVAPIYDHRSLRRWLKKRSICAMLTDLFVEANVAPVKDRAGALPPLRRSGEAPPPLYDQAV